MPRKSNTTNGKAQIIAHSKVELEKHYSFDAAPQTCNLFLERTRFPLNDTLTHCINTQQQPLLLEGTTKLCFLCVKPTVVTSSTSHIVPLAPFNMVTICTKCTDHTNVLETDMMFIAASGDDCPPGRI